MDAEYEARAAERRARWAGGVARSHQDLEQIDFEFWQRASPTQRFDAIRQMAIESGVISREHGSAPGLSGLPGGTRPRGR
jgi:hypothetical protein